MEDMVDLGLTKSLGVSNFNAQLIWDMMTYCKYKPVVNEIELNPSCAQHEFVRFLIDHKIRPIAYAPLSRPGRGGHKLRDGSFLTPENHSDLRQNSTIKNCAKKYKKSEVQVILNWGV